jgi:hypothetical protein
VKEITPEQLQEILRKMDEFEYPETNLAGWWERRVNKQQAREEFLGLLRQRGVTC